MEQRIVIAGAEGAPRPDPAPLDEALAGAGLSARWRAADYGGGACLRGQAAGDPAAILAALRPVLAGRWDALLRAADAPPIALMLSDMDATMVAEETLDELAGELGLKTRIAAITERAMRGELDFAAALAERVALLKGLEEAALARVAGRATPMPGGARLVAGLKARGVRCVLVSGGFTCFTGHVAGLFGFDAHRGNRLEIVDGTLTGHVLPPICGKEAKLALLEEECAAAGISPAAALALGDGANDLPMLRAAGLAVGVRPKPLVRDALVNHLDHAPLDLILALI